MRSGSNGLKTKVELAAHALLSLMPAADVQQAQLFWHCRAKHIEDIKWCSDCIFGFAYSLQV